MKVAYSSVWRSSNPKVGIVLLLMCVAGTLYLTRKTAPDWKCLQKSRLSPGKLSDGSTNLGEKFVVKFADATSTFHWTHTPRSKTCSHQKRHRVDVFAVVLSRPDSFSARIAIRDTWMNPRLSQSISEGQIRGVFLVGRHPDERIMKLVAEEAQEFDDVVLVDINDNYMNLPYKSIAAFLYAAKDCPESPLVMKIDEDVLLMPDMLYEKIRDGTISTNLSESAAYGHLTDFGVLPIRDSRDKWYSSIEAFPCPAMPPYISGPMYILTAKAASEILSGTARRNFLTIEDVLITGILAHDFSVALVNLPHVFYLPSSSSADETTPLVSWHGIKDPQKFRDLFHKFLISRCPPCQV
ncbi:unnamed protein product [Caenorhabditis auriculariae]|uniref:Hexosyltransferase n=1 Tax=Caenorhabditis auriculariae TaxID=2777116 RepID=A0A8S1H3N8_9PELO|nr:unnamed protein product [Caenorhabditis auriculariae]